MAIQEIMKGSYSSFMQKEIFEQPESVINTMRGRINLDAETIVLGGIKDFIPEIKRCRRLLLIGCGTSYHSAIAVSIYQNKYISRWINAFFPITKFSTCRQDRFSKN